VASVRGHRHTGRRVADGDTLSVLRDGKHTKVQLYGVNTPERQPASGITT